MVLFLMIGVGGHEKLPFGENKGFIVFYCIITGFCEEFKPGRRRRAREKREKEKRKEKEEGKRGRKKRKGKEEGKRSGDRSRKAGAASGEKVRGLAFFAVADKSLEKQRVLYYNILYTFLYFFRGRGAQHDRP